ncbi:MAG: sulfatase [Lentisphaeria bacterium]|nr:sulfatase [Lentisphaeria bacterium]
MNKRAYVKAVGLAGVGAISGTSPLSAPGAETIQRPNIIFILTDDQRWDAMSCLGHPFLKTPNMDRIRREGALFKNAFVTTSLCSPARASFLTGAYAHSHGVIGNWGCEFDHEETPSFPRVLKDAGYETAFVGKWHMGKNARPRPGFDYWLSFRGQGVYTDPTLNENGREFHAKGYITDLLTDYAVQYITKERQKPFCLYLSHKAVHSPFTPAPRHAGDFTDAPLPQPPNTHDTFAGKPAWLRGGPAYSKGQNDGATVPDSTPPQQWDPTEVRRRGYLRTIAAVDDGIGRIFKTLEERGELDRTIIMFAGDNGYFHGEHARGDKRLMYEESIRIPLIMRYPPAVKPNSTVDQMALNIDVAPTLLDLAGVPAPVSMQGRSMVPLLEGETDGWRASFLYEYWMDLTDRVPRMLGVRTEGWKLIRYPDIDDIDEMYDLKNDPYEMTNLALDPNYAGKRERLSLELDRLMKETGYGAKPIPQSPVVRRLAAREKRQTVGPQ